jgi:pentapeptide MXKDX repeat protein
MIIFKIGEGFWFCKTEDCQYARHWPPPESSGWPGQWGLRKSRPFDQAISGDAGDRLRHQSMHGCNARFRYFLKYHSYSSSSRILSGNRGATICCQSPKMSKDKMSKDKMSKDKMSKDKMSKDKMSKDKMSKDKMSKDKMSKKITANVEFNWPLLTAPARAR